MEETWELAVVSENGLQFLNNWYPNASAGMKNDIVSQFSEEGLDVGLLLDQCIHSQFGYEGIPLLAKFEDQPLLENALLALDVIQLSYCSIQFETCLLYTSDAADE